MKTRHILPLAILGLSSFMLTSCLDDQLPQTANATAEQVEKADKIGLVNGLIQYLNTPIADASQYVYTGLGYPEHVIWHDIMTQDLPILSTGYNYWTAYSECLYIGNWAWQSYYWWYYNQIIYKATLVIRNCQRGSADDAFALANGLALRAFAMFDMTRMYEFKPTGTSLDGAHYSRLKGLTVPIINEYSTEEQAKHNPRAPYYKMYRYILNDLTLAEQAIDMSGVTPAKNYASSGMINGLLARFWMELGSRFERHPEDLAEQIEHDYEQYPDLGEGYQNLPPIGVTSANDAFAKAAQCARKAMSGYSPVTKSEWYDVTTGFNAANHSWIWCILMSSSDKMVTEYTWESWASFMCPEAGWGIASPNYRGAFMIDAALYKSIEDGDWRKLTWVDPADWLPDNASLSEEQEFEATFNRKYAPLTQLSFEDWSELGPYVSFKFRPGSGNTSSSQTGNKVDIPLMRVEEMYLIEAEALAHTQGLGAGKAALESFVNAYRYEGGNTYTCNASSKRSFEKEVLRQKRLEFWGEGVALYDYKRLELPIERGYADSNHPKSHRFNSLDGYVAPWTILYIPLSEQQQNSDLLLNPDPTSIMLELKYQN